MEYMNPFDFSSPVSEPHLFAGRSRELAELDYYLTLAKNRRSPGLAIVGQRTSGKTSLLNMASANAIRHSFLSARLDLTDADVVGEETFLRSLYEALFLAARRKKLWADQTERVYEAFRASIDARDPKDLHDFCPLTFPKAYASAAAAGHSVSNYPVALLIDDLRSFLSSALLPTCSGVCLLIDEADLLSRLPAALQKLRHLMMVAKSLVVIVAGTEQMLGGMDAVFAPIVRHFKRIRLKPFISPSETRQCLLQRLAVVQAEGILASDTYLELHNLAQGQPYEAQLVAHHAYRRYCEHPDEGFSVTITVLNDVLAEVERFREDEHGRFAETLRSYTRAELQQLGSIVLYPSLSLYERAKIDAALTAPGGVKDRISKARTELKSHASKFTKDRVVSYNRRLKAYQLSGDQFDHLYVKLLARSMRLPWIVDDRPMVELTEEILAGGIASAIDARTFPSFFIEPGDQPREQQSTAPDTDMAFSETRYYEVLGKIAGFIRGSRFRRLASELDAGKAHYSDAPHATWLPTLFADAGAVASIWFRGERVPTIHLTLKNLSSDKTSTLWLQPADFTITTEDWSTRVREFLAAHRRGIEALDWVVAITSLDEESPPSFQSVVRACQAGGWDGPLEHVSEVAQAATVQRYLAGQVDVAEAIARAALPFSTGPERARHLNNLGYLNLSTGHLAEAKQQLEEAAIVSAPWTDLSRYNLSVCNARLGDVETATEQLTELQKLIASERVKNQTVAVVQILQPSDGTTEFRYREARQCDLEEAINLSLLVVRKAARA